MRIERPSRGRKLATMVMAVVATVSFTAAVAVAIHSYRRFGGPSGKAPKPIALEELSEFVPAASFAVDGNHLSVRVTDDWIRVPSALRDTQFTALCYTIADRYYHTASIEDLQGHVLARWHGGMIELLR